MCLIMTIIAALAFSAVYLFQKNKGSNSKPLFSTMLMFWAAALMWSVDGIASVLEGEGFFDISKKDAELGVIIVVAGLAAYAFFRFIESKKNSVKAA